MNNILVHNNWDKLEEIWLGDTWPYDFYEDLDSEVRDNFQKLTEWTKEDLQAVEKKFQDFGVIVRRPEIKQDQSLYRDKNNRLVKPPICPRDFFGVIGDQLFYNKMEMHGTFEWAESFYDHKHINKSYKLSGANMVKLGRDIIFDHALGDYWNCDDQEIKLRMFKCFQTFSRNVLPKFENDYRIHFSATGGHLDGQFMPVRPGIVLASNHWDDYDLILPGWDKIIISQPSWLTENADYKQNLVNNKNNFCWYLTGGGAVFNEYVEEFCQEWIGNYKETYFEVNIVMLDENNLMCIDTSNNHNPVYEYLDKSGINVHVVPWRTRAFWDGGLHCITLDVRRQSKGIQDYFPERGSNGLKSILHDVFGNSMDSFFEEYNKWLNK